MKKIAITLLIIFVTFNVWAQSEPCDLSNATGCLCPDGSDTCDLLPDIKVSEYLLLDYDSQPEYFGELRVSSSTPNVGYGPLSVISSDYFVCGTDTIYSEGGLETCADGSYPKQLLKQIVYRKEGDVMTSYERWAGSMTYHPTHEHMHVDDWCSLTLRTPVEGVPPTQWPIVVEGAKVGFCLMDYGSCNSYEGHCVNEEEAVVTSENQPNYGLGGGEYSCGFDQGISAGFTDIYYYYLDGMDIQLPSNMCDGEYWLVVIADPKNHFLEMDPNNNWAAAPITLSKQNEPTTAIMTLEGNTTICKGESVTLAATIGDLYEWSNGETSQSITVTESGTYSVITRTPCIHDATTYKEYVSEEITITVVDVSPVVADETICKVGTVDLMATGDGLINWYDTADSEDILATGNTFTSPEISETRSFYVEQSVDFEGMTSDIPPYDYNFGNSGYNSASYNGFLIFDAHQPFTLKSVRVFGDPADAGERTFEIRNADSTVVTAVTVFVEPNEEEGAVVILDLDVPVGENLQFGTTEYPGFLRNNTDVAYPYDIEGVMAIKGSNYDVAEDNNYYYYYFYNWTIKQADFSCVSEREEVIVQFTECVGLNNNIATVHNIQVQPNPSKGIFTVHFDLLTAQSIVLEVHNIAGKVVYNQALGQLNGAFNQVVRLSDLPEGMYMLSIKTETESFNQKIVLH